MRRERRLLAPSVVLTGRQTAGRGRGVNVWHAPAGVITVTFVLPASDTLPPQHVPFIAGLAVRDAIVSFGVPGLGIKWPNDLWHEDRKLAGLLCERVDRIDLIGVGLNANVLPKDLPKSIASTSIRAITNLNVDVTDLVVAIAHGLRKRLGDARTSLASVRSELQQADVLLHRPIRVTQTGDVDLEGVAAGIDSSGRLLVRSGSKTHSVLNGTVRLMQ